MNEALNDACNALAKAIKAQEARKASQGITIQKKGKTLYTIKGRK